jgi:hypothetical protein
VIRLILLSSTINKTSERLYQNSLTSALFLICQYCFSIQTVEDTPINEVIAVFWKSSTQGIAHEPLDCRAALAIYVLSGQTQDRMVHPSANESDTLMNRNTQRVVRTWWNCRRSEADHKSQVFIHMSSARESFPLILSVLSFCFELLQHFALQLTAESRTKGLLHFSTELGFQKRQLN